MNFKFIYEGISKETIFSILTIIQFTIGLICVYVAIEFINDINNSVKSINTYFDDGNYYKIDNKMVANEIMTSDREATKRNVVIIQDIKDYFDSNDNIDFLSVTSNAVLVRKDVAMNETLVTYSSIKVEDTEYMRAQGFYANKTFLEKMNYEFLDGEIGEFKRDEETDYIPAILGYTYKDKYSVGDEIQTLTINDEGDYKKAQIKVVGILTEDNYIHVDGITSSRQSLKSAIVIPFYQFDMGKDIKSEKLELIKRIELTKYMQGGYVLLNNNESPDDINAYLLNSGLKFQLKDLNKSIETHKNESVNAIKPGMYVAIIVILFSVISVVIVMINSIVKDKKEFGINIMLGATMTDIRIRVLGEVFLLLGISVVISIAVLKSFSIFRFNILDLFLTIGVMIGIVLIISTIIILTLNKYSVNDLIRRND